MPLFSFSISDDLIYQACFCFLFQTFFNSPCMSAVTDSFCVYHVHAPGQEKGAKALPEDFVYPSMEGLSEQVGLGLQLLLYSVSQKKRSSAKKG